MSFNELNMHKQQLVRAGYYKVHKHYLNNKAAADLTHDDINKYANIRLKAMRKEEAMSTITVWTVGVGILCFFLFTWINGSSNDTTTDSTEKSSDIQSSEPNNTFSSEPVPVQSEYYSDFEPEPDTVYDSSCNPNYSGCVDDSSYDLDCADVGHSVSVIGYDEYGLDRDGDGYGCESY